MSHRPDQRDPDRRYTFPKSHRLKRRRLIRSLFDRRREDVGTVAVGCIRLLFRRVDREALGYDVPVQVGFAPGRRVESGVERNRVRRLLRETYRVHQHTLTDRLEGHPDALVVMILFRGAPEQADDCIEEDLPAALTQAVVRLPRGVPADATSSDPGAAT